MLRKTFLTIFMLTIAFFFAGSALAYGRNKVKTINEAAHSVNARQDMYNKLKKKNKKSAKKEWLRAKKSGKAMKKGKIRYRNGVKTYDYRDHRPDHAAIPVTPATPAIPGAPGEAATPAVPATPAIPASQLKTEHQAQSWWKRVKDSFTGTQN